jgi:hypothetical protein
MASGVVKKGAVIALALLGFAAASYAQTSGPGPQNSTAEDLAEAEVSIQSKDSRVVNESVSFEESGSSVRFSGVLQAPTPCYNIDDRTMSPSENTTVVDIRLDRENDSLLCTQQVSAISYSGSIARSDGTVEIRHNGDTVGSFEATREKSGGLIERFLSVLSQLL